MMPGELRQIVERSAKRVYWPEIVAELKSRLPQGFLPLAINNLIYYLPSVIVELPSKNERRAAIDAIPDDCEPWFLKEDIMHRVRFLYSSARAINT